MPGAMSVTRVVPTAPSEPRQGRRGLGRHGHTGPDAARPRLGAGGLHQQPPDALPPGPGQHTAVEDHGDAVGAAMLTTPTGRPPRTASE